VCVYICTGEEYTYTQIDRVFVCIYVYRRGVNASPSVCVRDVLPRGDMGLYTYKHSRRLNTHTHTHTHVHTYTFLHTYIIIIIIIINIFIFIFIIAQCAHTHIPYMTYNIYICIVG
jgi:hypothetical protein